VGVNPELKECVGFLYVEAEQGGKIPVGTCFCLTVMNPERTFGYGYLVTAKHVYDRALHGRRSYVRFNRLIPTPGEPGVRYVPLEERWHFHSDPSVDLAVLDFTPTTNNFTATSLPLHEITRTPEVLGGHWPPQEAEEVLFIGLSTQITGQERNVPIVRRGSVAMVTDELIEGV